MHENNLIQRQVSTAGITTKLLDAPSQFILKNVNLPFLLAFIFFQSTRQKLLVHNEGERYKIAGNWWDWKVRLSCGRTVCRVGDGKGRGYPPFTGGIWGPPLGKMFSWGFLKSVIQCTLSNQGKKFSHEDDTLFYPQVHQQNLSVGNQNLWGTKDFKWRGWSKVFLGGKIWGITWHLEIWHGIFWGLIFGPGIFWGSVGSPRDFFLVFDFCPHFIIPITWKLE